MQYKRSAGWQVSNSSERQQPKDAAEQQKAEGMAGMCSGKVEDVVVRETGLEAEDKLEGRRRGVQCKGFPLQLPPF